jgi:eukaryotic-like serine/threonine-protein kinase
MLDPLASRFGQAAILSGLMDVESVMACWNAIPAAKRDAPEHIDRRLARQALQSRALTLWQAQQLLAGRTSGFKVDRYVLLELIGQGGMGRVYLARDTRLNRRVALKILAPERMSNPRAVARFQREARVGAQLQHENLVRIYDFGEANGRFFLVMEYIDGKTIGHLLSEQGPMPPATAARLALQVAQGLSHAHRKALIHRDVNPYNIMVTHDGTAKLTDLGLAIDLSEGDRVTREGATVGTFDYVAPEQARHSHAADIRSDIYSLGCTIYHMLTGHVPFPSPSLPEKLFAHQAMEPTPLEQLVEGLPAGLGDVVRTMMRKQPDERYSTPAQVVDALEPYLDEGPTTKGTEPGRSPSDASPRHSADGFATSAPNSDRAAGRPGSASGIPSSPALTPAPIAQSSDRPSGIAASGASPAPETSVSQATMARPSTGGGTTVAGNSTPSSADPDDSNVPLLTPTDDVEPEHRGLPIVLDLGPEPPLRLAAARSRSAAGSGFSAVFRRAVRPAPSTGVPAGAIENPSPWRLGSAWRTRHLWIRGAIAAAVVVAVLTGLIGSAGGLGLLRKWTPFTASEPKVRAGLNTEIADRALSPRQEGPPIIVRFPGEVEGDQAVKTLMDAVKLAMGGGRGQEGYVELRNRAPLRCVLGDFKDLESASGRLEIRGADGVQPVLEVQMDPNQPFLATGLAVSLSLSRLTIRASYQPSPGAIPPIRPPVIHAAGRVKIDRCAFEVVGTPTDGCRAVVCEGGSLSINHSWFLGFDEAIRVKAYETTVTEIRQTMIVPRSGAAPVASSERRGWALAIELSPIEITPAPPKRQLVLEHCTVEGAGFVAVSGSAGASPLRTNVKQCAVRAEALLAWQPPKAGSPLDADLRWEGDGNQFHIQGRSWIVQSAATMNPALSLGATDLASWSKFVSREAQPIRTHILYLPNPHKQADLPRPRDFAIESSDPPADRAGANPEVVGPWSH